MSNWLSKYHPIRLIAAAWLLGGLFVLSPVEAADLFWTSDVR